MHTITIRTSAHRPYIGLCALVASLATLLGCSGGGGSDDLLPFLDYPDQPPPPPADNFVGGVWVGTEDISGHDILGLTEDTSAEATQLVWLDRETGELAVGQLFIKSFENTVIAEEFSYLLPFEKFLPDGGTRAECGGAGTIERKQLLTITLDCTSNLGSQFSKSAQLSYDTLYERNRTLAAIAGTYDHAGAVLTIDANGVVFEQDPLSACTINGQINTYLDLGFPQAHYRASMDYANCTGAHSSMNDTNFVATWVLLDDSLEPDRLTFIMSGGFEVGVFFAHHFTADRL